MALSSITKYCADNIPGLYTIEYGPLANIDTDAFVPGVVGHVFQAGVTFNVGDWLELPVFYRPDQLWNQSQNDTRQGRSFDSIVSGTTPRLRLEAEEQFEQMHNHPFLIRLRDRNGLYWLLGSPENPFYFQANAAIGNGRNQYDIRFAGVLPNRAYGLTV